MEGGSNVDGDESGGTSPSRQGADTGILVPRSLLAMAAENGIASGKSTSILGISSAGAKYRPKEGARGGGTTAPEGSMARPRGTRAGHPSGPLVVALLPCLGYSGSFRDADFLYNFFGIFGALLIAGKPEIQKRQKQELALRCTELID